MSSAPGPVRRLLRHPDFWLVGLVLVLAAVLRVAFFQHAPVFFEGDARGYLVRAVEIVSGDGVDFSLKRTPGYSLLIAATFTAVGPSLEAVIGFQHLLGVCTAVLTYGCGRAVGGRAVGVLAGSATAASGSMLVYEHAVLTESLFTFLLVAGVWLLVVGLRRGPSGWLVAAGLLAGLGAAVRPVGLTLPLVVPGILAALLGPWRGTVASAVYLLPFALILLPWVAYNAHAHGEATPVHPGRFLIERTIKSNQTGVSMYAAPSDPDDPRLVREGHKILRDIEPEEPTSFEVHAALSRRLDLSDAETSDLMWDLATDAIRREPDVYLSGTWLELVALVQGQHESVRQHADDRRAAWKGEDLEALLDDGTIPELLPDTWPEQERRLPVAEMIAGVYQPSHWIAVLLLATAAAAMWGVRHPARRTVLVPLAVAVAVVLCTIAINGAYPRYRYPLDPLLHITAAAGLIWTIRAWRSARPMRRGASPEGYEQP
jgi:4-amino-4-deoxy-L-arabinose transferase-like glycosyltransferase